MLLKRRGPLPVLALALALVGVSEGVAAAQTPREVALKYAVDNAQAFGVTPADVANLTVTYEYRSAHNGVTHVNVRQVHEDLEVFEGNATINVASGNRVIFAGGNLVRLPPSTASSAQLDAVDAVEAAADKLDLDSAGGPARAALQESRATRSLSTGGISAEPIPAKLGYSATKARPAPGVDGHDRRCRGRAPVGGDGRRRQRRAAAQGRLELARQDAESGQRRVELPRVRVPEAGPERRRAHVGDQPSGRVRLSVRVA